MVILEYECMITHFCKAALLLFEWSKISIWQLLFAEKQIFEHWFEETADDYFPWTKNQGLDDETIRANASVSFSYALLAFTQLFDIVIVDDSS